MIALISEAQHFQRTVGQQGEYLLKVMIFFSFLSCLYRSILMFFLLLWQFVLQ